LDKTDFQPSPSTSSGQAFRDCPQDLRQLIGLRQVLPKAVRWEKV
jgi:hypothetical protein